MTLGYPRSDVVLELKGQSKVKVRVRVNSNMAFEFVLYECLLFLTIFSSMEIIV